jgi:hypothetical protein
MFARVLIPARGRVEGEARPVLRAAALQASIATIDGARFPVLKQLGSLQLKTLHLASLRINRVQLKNPLRDIETDNLRHEKPPQQMWRHRLPLTTSPGGAHTIFGKTLLHL